MLKICCRACLGGATLFFEAAGSGEWIWALSLPSSKRFEMARNWDAARKWPKSSSTARLEMRVPSGGRLETARNVSGPRKTVGDKQVQTGLHTIFNKLRFRSLGVAQISLSPLPKGGTRRPDGDHAPQGSPSVSGSLAIPARILRACGSRLSFRPIKEAGGIKSSSLC